MEDGGCMDSANMAHMVQNGFQLADRCVSKRQFSLKNQVQTLDLKTDPTSSGPFLAVSPEIWQPLEVAGIYMYMFV